MSAAAILLAAGASSRMGRPKPLLDWHGQPLIAAQVDALAAAGCAPIIAVLGSRAREIRSALPAAAQAVTNHAWRQGRAGSIRAAARAVPAHAKQIVIASVDQPCAPAGIRRTIDALAAEPGARIAVPRYRGRNGHPPAFDAALLPALRRVGERRQGLRAIRRSQRGATIFIEVDDPAVLLNLNSPADYERARPCSRSV